MMAKIKSPWHPTLYQGRRPARRHSNNYIYSIQHQRSAVKKRRRARIWKPRMIDALCYLLLAAVAMGIMALAARAEERAAAEYVPYAPYTDEARR